MDSEFGKFNLEFYTPTTSDSNIINELYKETPMQQVLDLKDLLALPVNRDYERNTLQFSEQRFRIPELNLKSVAKLNEP